MSHPLLLDRIAASVSELHADALLLSRAMASGSRSAVDTLIGDLGALIVSINTQRGPDQDALVALRHTATALTHLVHAAEHLASEDTTAHDGTAALHQVQSAVRCLHVAHSDLLRAGSRRLGPAARILGAAA
ncbi:hypothetical protein [Streptacidiphilus neutrinimicus]|uniref:hypothetical protein n=1 Tax=Streptacidiphilus neutrinimicus TaxID=105420 RepID=UPI0005A7C7D8|nr:hypothetical protein [Streptacidiphilus neutrinimicus]